jgi:toxin ParE1/3/4
MRVVVRAAAERDLDRIYEWIAKDNPRAALGVIERIVGRITLLELDALAHMGRPGVLEGTRELIEFPYVIVYQVFEEHREIAVLAILHGAQKRPRHDR